MVTVALSGAVVAREYGLPSLIAVNNATDVFTTGEDCGKMEVERITVTGDLVELNATKGVISKVSEH